MQSVNGSLRWLFANRSFVDRLFLYHALFCFFVALPTVWPLRLVATVNLFVCGLWW